ncbi:tape measure protein, partial [Basfia succiniciproducens]|uniref:tape measure protein n=1 Tax=Basfia succiniciproducens TaxID=653940 RepID=UPI0008B9BAD2
MAFDRMIIELGLEQAKFNTALTNAQNRLQSFSAKTSKYLNNIERAANNINTNTGLMFWTDIGSRAGGAFSMLTKYADGYTEIANKLRLVESAGIDGAKGLQSIFDISMQTNQSVQATSDVYQRFAQNAKQLGISQAQVASLTDTVSKAVAISGASAASAQAALMQFGQSLASGVFRGQEFNSVMEQTPGLAQAIARGLNVTTGELRALANDGKLTMDVLIPALEAAKASVDEQFSTRVLTVSAAFENLKTSTTKWIGELDQATGSSAAFANSIGFVADHLTSFGTGAAAVGVSLITGKINSMIKAGHEQALMAVAAAEAETVRTGALRAQAAAEMNLLQIKVANARTDAERIAVINQITAAEGRLTSAINAEAAAQRNLAVAQKATSAGGRLLSGALGLVGGPLGALAVGLTTGIGIWMEYNQKTEEAHQKALALADDLPKLTAELEKLNSVQLGARQAKAEESIIAQQKEVQKLEKDIKKLENTIRNTPKLNVFTDDTGYKIEIDNSRTLAQLNRDLAQAKAELQTAQEKLNATQEAANDISAQMATTYQNELDNALSNFRTALYGADVDLAKFNGSVLEAGNAASGVQGPLSGMIDRLLRSGDAARDGASGLMAFASAAKAAAGQDVQFPFRLKNSATPADDKQRAFLKQIQTQNQIDGAKTRGDFVSLNIRRDLDSRGIFAGNELYDEAYRELESKYGKQWDARQAKGTKKTKSGGKGVDYQKQYTDQITEMQSRLAELNANAEDIRLFGQTSQYQEVNKLTQDIAANAEKYKNYGAEGVEKLKSLAE